MFSYLKYSYVWRNSLESAPAFPADISSVEFLQKCQNNSYICVCEGFRQPHADVCKYGTLSGNVPNANNHVFFLSFWPVFKKKILGFLKFSTRPPGVVCHMAGTTTELTAFSAIDSITRTEHSRSLGSASG